MRKHSDATDSKSCKITSIAILSWRLKLRNSARISDCVMASSALDAITQSEILALFRSLSRQLNMAMLFISHDLLSVASLCSRIAILQEGRIVETGFTEQMFRDPRTEDTRALLQAVMRNPFVDVGVRSGVHAGGD